MEKQVENDAEVEVIVVYNRISETGQERALELEKKRHDSVIIVNVSGNAHTQICLMRDCIAEIDRRFKTDQKAYGIRSLFVISEKSITAP